MSHRLKYMLTLGRFLLRTTFRVLFYWPGLLLATLALLTLLTSSGNEGSVTLEHGTLRALWQNLVFTGFLAEVTTVALRPRRTSRSACYVSVSTGDDRSVLFRAGNVRYPQQTGANEKKGVCDE